MELKRKRQSLDEKRIVVVGENGEVMIKIA
jgi:hypothetical protein